MAYASAEPTVSSVTELDLELDRHLPPALRSVSSLFWTAAPVIERGVGWLDELGVGDVVDLGSGVGKWCVGAALLARTPRRYVGLEHRSELVAIANQLAEGMGVADRVTFHGGEISELLAKPGPIPGLAASPAFYLFNPFGENVAPDAERLDAAVELSEARYHRDVAVMEDLLAIAPSGTWVLVYNGFGGRMPSGYEPVRTAEDHGVFLRLWQKGPR